MTISTKLDSLVAKITTIIDAHEHLFLAIEDFVNSPLSEGSRKRLEAALQHSKKVIVADD